MDQEKIILGIDPGTMVMGYGVIREQGKKMELLTMGVINEKSASGLWSHSENATEGIYFMHPSKVTPIVPE